jgi:hypothetical protein
MDSFFIILGYALWLGLGGWALSNLLRFDKKPTAMEGTVLFVLCVVGGPFVAGAVIAILQAEKKDK